MDIEKILLAIVLIPLFFVMIDVMLDPGNPENPEKVVKAGTHAIVDEATPWWLPFLELGAIGVAIVVGLAFFAPKIF